MKIKEGFELREICGEYIVIAHGDRNIDFSNVICLNESSALMWKTAVTKDFTHEDLCAVLMDTYEVEEDIAKNDVARIVEEWKNMGIIE